MDYNGKTRLSSLAFKDLKLGVKKCRAAEMDLRSSGHTELADNLDAIVSRLEILIETKIAPIIGIPKNKVGVVQAPNSLKHPLESDLKEIWLSVFPNYVFSDEDRILMRKMFKSLDRDYPQANKEFIKRGIINYKNSDEDWLGSHELHIFCKHFPRKFLDKPLKKMVIQPIKA